MLMQLRNIAGLTARDIAEGEGKDDVVDFLEGSEVQ